MDANDFIEEYLRQMKGFESLHVITTLDMRVIVFLFVSGESEWNSRVQVSISFLG